MENLSLQDAKMIIEVFSSPKQKITFLENLYKNGNRELLPLLLEVNPQGGKEYVLLEFDYELTAGRTEVGLDAEYCKTLIQKMLLKGSIAGVVKRVFQSGQENLIHYLIEEVKRKNNYYSSHTLINELRLYDPESVYLHDLLEHRLYLALRDNLGVTSVTTAFKDLGKYENAIQHYIRHGSKSQHWYDAWNLVDSVRPFKQSLKLQLAKAIYRQGYEIFADHFEEMYYDVLLWLEKHNRTVKRKQIAYIYDFRKQLESHVDRLLQTQKIKPPQAYISLVKLLKRLGLKEKLEAIIEKLLTLTAEKQDFMKHEIWKDLGYLLFSVNKKDVAYEYFSKYLTYQIQKCHPAQGWRTIEELRKLFEDETLFLLEQADLLIREEKFLEAKEFCDNYPSNEVMVNKSQKLGYLLEKL